MDKNFTDRKFRVTGIIMTLMVTIGLFWAAGQWLHRYDWPRPITDKEREANCVKAFENLQLICAAQEKYKQEDWDEDGQKVYSRYFPHLWTTLNKESDPVLIELIPQKLAFAMGPEGAVNGYFYNDISERALDSIDNTRKNDYTKEWAIVAIDATYGQKAMRVFLADNSGKILMKYTNAPPQIWPQNPLANGWEIITSVDQIKH
jgi:hypothetical protein